MLHVYAVKCMLPLCDVIKCTLHFCGVWCTLHTYGVKCMLVLRTGSDMPSRFLTLAGKPVIIAMLPADSRQG